MWRWVNAMIVLGLLVSAAARGAEWKASKPEVRKEVVAVIEAQLAAFRERDLKRAHDLASRELRAQKPLPVFSQIVQANYPELWANTRAEFGIVRDDGGQATVTVHVYSKAGDAAYDYTLVKERQGWRVHGVVRHEAKGGRV